MPKNKSKEINDILVNFIKVMEANFSKKDLTNMYNNLLTLKIVPKKDNFIDNLLSLYKLGEYYCKKNKIKLYTDNVKEVLNHELLHMSSYSKRNNLRYVGLDDAYTQFLANYYFNEKTINYIILFVEYLDKVIGHDILSKMYLNNKLKNVINLLEPLATDDEIYSFVKNMNILYNKSYCDLEKIQKYIDEVFNFIVTIYARMQYGKFKNNIIKSNECYFSIVFFVIELRKKLELLKKIEEDRVEIDINDLKLRLELK